MEKKLVALEKELKDLDNIEGDVWRQLNKWEKKFWGSVDINKSKYDWCKEEFENIHSLNKEKFPKDSFRGIIDNYKKLFEKIINKNR